MGFLKKMKKTKQGGGGTSSSSASTRNGSRHRPAPQDGSHGGGGSTLGNGSSYSYLGSTMNGNNSISSGGAHRTAAATAQGEHDYRYRGKNPHRRMNKEHAHHHPSSSSGGAAAGYTVTGAAGAAAALTPTADNSSVNPSMALIPGLVRDLETAPTASGDVPARALRTLFSLSEHGGNNGGGGSGSTVNGSGKTPSESESNRTAMVRQDGGRLVPVLLGFLRRCERGSSEQYLALLVLNNISIPTDNKRVSVLGWKKSLAMQYPRNFLGSSHNHIS